MALAGIAVGFAALHLMGDATPLSVWAMNFSMMIGLAVGIDYSLFIVSRYREEREDGHDAADAIANTLTTAGKAVFLSALTVVLSLAAVFVVPVMVFRSMALGMILSVVAVALAALTLLPPCWSRSATGCSWSATTRTPTAPPRAAGPAGPDTPCATPDAPSSPASPCSSCSPRPPSGCTWACPAPASSTRAARAATATT